MGLSSSVNILPLNEQIVYTDRTVCIISLMHNTIAFLYILKINYVNKELSLANPYRRTVFHSTAICMTMFLLFNLSLILLTFNVKLLGCHILLLFGILTYCALKLSFWIFNAIRLKVVFHTSAYAYSPSFHRILYIVLIVNALIMVLVSVIYGIYIGDGYIIFVSEFYSCVVQTSWLIAGLIATGEAFANIACYWLFWRKIKEIIQDTSMARELRYVTRKYAILIATSILSTYSFMALIVFTDLAYTVAAIDSCINFWCLVLFDVRFDRIYFSVFGCIAKKQRALSLETPGIDTNTGNTGNVRNDV